MTHKEDESSKEGGIKELWDQRYSALEQYVAQSGTARVPATYVMQNGKSEVRLGSWVSYLRTRYRKGLLTYDLIERLERLPGWEWGPLRPGPESDRERDLAIRELRSQGLSLAEIGKKYGLTRQRIHQIIGTQHTETTNNVE